jgi:hypothetical protein
MASAACLTLPGPDFANLTQGLPHRRSLRIHVFTQAKDLQATFSLVASNMNPTHNIASQRPGKIPIR